jgi:hypothetical protein
VRKQVRPYAGLVNLPPDQLAALLVAISFASGLNVYATLATLGLLARFGLVSLPGTLHLVSNTWIIAAGGAMFVTEFFADKIPAFDLIWNTLHTFVRVPIAALVAYAATSRLCPGKQLLAAALGGVIALAAHGGKTALRAVVTPSPEPFSNITLSAGEDAVSIGLTWFATQHPFWAAAIAGAFLLTTVVLVRRVMRAVRALFRGSERGAMG